MYAIKAFEDNTVYDVTKKANDWLKACNDNFFDFKVINTSIAVSICSGFKMIITIECLRSELREMESRGLI